MIPAVVDYRSQLRSAIGAVEICSPFEFRWLGVSVEAIPRRFRSMFGGPRARAALIGKLTDQLYRCFYAVGGIARPEPQRTSGERLPFMRSCADVLREGWQGPSFECTNGYFILDHGLGRPRASTEMLRIYLNTAPDDAASLAVWLASRMKFLSVAFTVKFLDDPAEYARSDTCVLYIESVQFQAASSVLRGDQPTHTPLRPPIPAFTKMIAVGIGLAEDPERGGSFGMDRCALVAEGLLRSHERGIADVDGRLGEVVQCFAERQLSVDEPYLNPGSDDIRT